MSVDTSAGKPQGPPISRPVDGLGWGDERRQDGGRMALLSKKSVIDQGPPGGHGREVPDPADGGGAEPLKEKDAMEQIVNLHVEKLPEGVYLATSDEVQGLVAQGRTLQDLGDCPRCSAAPDRGPRGAGGLAQARARAGSVRLPVGSERLRPGMRRNALRLLRPTRAFGLSLTK